MAAPIKVDANVDASNLTTYTIAPSACVAGQLHSLLLRTTDAGGQRTLVGCTGTNGFNVSQTVRATFALSGVYGGLHIATFVPSSSTPGNLLPEFSGGCESLVWELLRWPDGDTTTPCPSTVATAPLSAAAAEAAAVTHGAMADGTNNYLLSLLHIAGASTGHTADANYTAIDGSPLAGETGYFWAQYALGNADLVCNTIWTTARLWSALTLEFAVAGAGASGVSGERGARRGQRRGSRRGSYHRAAVRRDRIFVPAIPFGYQRRASGLYMR